MKKEAHDLRLERPHRVARRVKLTHIPARSRSRPCWRSGAAQRRRAYVRGGRVASAHGRWARLVLVFPPAGLKSDLAVPTVTASLENLAEFAYTAGLHAATAGSLGVVPPTVATFAITARAQHAEHATA